MTDLQSYLSNDYPGYKSFLEVVIKPIFQDNFEPNEKLLGMPDSLVNRFENIINTTADAQLKKKAEDHGLTSILCLGEITLMNTESPIIVYDITVKENKKLAKNRKDVQDLIRSVLGKNSGAFMIFHYSNQQWEWRFSYCWKGMSDEDSTNAKRFTYLLGRGQACKTAALRFKGLKVKKGNIKLEDITDAFNVEALSKEFFEKYKVRYGRFVGHVIGKEYIDKGDGKGEWREKEGLTPSELFYGLKQDEKLVRDYIKKLLGRIVFLHFLQKKGWLGATDKEWTNGPQDFMLRLFDKATADQQANFLDEILEPLFSCLDTPLNERREVFDTKVDELRSVRVPFLGGLFERTEEDKAISLFPSDLFADLFKFLSEYNFTIDENDPNDAQVGVDPEMLGRIFENLLEDNKDKGAFYTPKEIVQYMCRESLIAYLQTDVTDEATREALRKFVTTHDVKVLGGKESPLALNVSQCLKDVKICDPAIGSGAFPMGLLNELFLCRGVIEDFANAADIKRHIIQQNIYGVDIEKGAVEIARLRFWLSLITDADTPMVLPNMDFKIMQGNSLLEQYKGVPLQNIMETKTEVHEGHQLNIFEDKIDVIRAEVKHTIQNYYSEKNHDMRRTMREGIQQKIQRQIEIQSINVDISDIKDIAANDQFFLWHTWFSEVFEEGGFDIVIGNPPYGAKLSDADKELFKSLFSDVHMRTPETFCYFISQAIRLAKNSNAVVSFIVPNNLFFQNENEKTRELLIFKNKLLRAINLGDSTFENADVPTCIFVATTGNSPSYSIAYSDYREEKVCTIDWNQGVEQIDNNILKNIPAFSLGMNLKEISILDKVKAKGISIDEIAEEMASGISTGNNKAFLMLQRKAEELNIESSIVRKILMGYEIDKFMISSDTNVIVYTPRDIAIDNYPNARKWLELYKEKLQSRSESKKGILPWYSLGRARYKLLFEEPKIIMRQTSDCIRCTFDEEGFYVLNSILVFKKNTNAFDYQYITGVLNSSVTNFIYQGLTQEVGRAFAEVKPANVRKLSIPNVGIDKQNPIIKIVNEIVMMKKQNPQADTSTLEHEIDLLVYDLYGLTEEEIQIIENS